MPKIQNHTKLQIFMRTARIEKKKKSARSTFYVLPARHCLWPQVPAGGRSRQKGFTLLEIIVSIGLFSIVMLIATGALLSMVNANRKAQALKNVMNNVNFAAENMVKEIRVGTSYHGNVEVGSITSPQNAENVSSFAFEKSGGDPETASDQVVFRLSDGVIERSDDGGLTYSAITSSGIDIELLRFWVYGSDPLDTEQPRVAIVIKGSAFLQGGDEDFNIQTTATQRLLD